MNFIRRLDRQTPEKRNSHRSLRLALAVQLTMALAVLTGAANRTAEAAPICPPSPTDGSPAAFCVVPDGRELRAQLEVQRTYFIDTDKNGEHNPGKDQEVQGVSGAQIIVEHIKRIGSSDRLDLDLESRKIENGVVKYLDKKSGIWREVDGWTVVVVPEDGGDGLGIDAKTGSKIIEDHLTSDDQWDKIWGRKLQDGPDNKDCSKGGECGWQCVNHNVATRLKSGVKAVDKLKAGELIANNELHRDENSNALSARQVLVYFYDVSQVSDPQAKEFLKRIALSTPVEPNSPLWNREHIKFGPVDIRTDAHATN